MMKNMKHLAENFQQSARKLWHERWNILVGFVWLCVLVLIAALLSGCATPQTPNSLAPNVAAEAARQTKESYQAQEDFFNAQATSTSAAQTQIALAPVVAMTQTAGEFAMQQTYAQATTTSAALTQTAYADQQALIAQSTSTAGVATQIAAFTQQAFQVQIQNDNLALEGARTVNILWAMSPYAVGFAVILVGIALSYVLIKRLAYVPNPVDERGKPRPMFEVLEGVAYDIDRATNGMIGVSKKFLALLPEVTADRQNETTTRAQLTDLHTRVARIPKRLLETQSAGLLPDPGQPLLLPPRNFLLPAWDIINGWDSKDGLPYYTAKGLETFSIDKVPHLSVIGETGSGKSRRFLRPLIACALAAGYRVVIIGKAKDYHPFERHPNATLIRISNVLDPDQALRYANILGAVVEEMNRRDEVLISKNKSTWSDAGYVSTIIVCDEISNSLNIMDKANRVAANQTRAWSEGLVAEGRAVGLHMWFGSQRATKMLGIYSQTRKAIFRVAPEEEAQHRSMSGASSLETGYYIAKFGSSQLAGGFEPTDADLLQFMASRPVKPLESDQWIDAIATDVPLQIPAQDSVKLSAPLPTVTEFVNGLTEWEVKVVELYEAGWKQIAIVASVFAGDDPAVGNAAVADLIQRWRDVKGVGAANAADDTALKEAELDQIRKKNAADELRKRTEEELQIKLLNEKGLSKTDIVYAVWGRSSADFKERMARVKEVLGTSTSLQREKSPEMPMNNALPA